MAKRWSSGSEDKTIKLWNAQTEQEIRTLTRHSEAVWSVVFAPDGKTLISGSFDTNIKLWNVAGGQEIKSFAEPSGMIISLALSPDGKTIASGVQSSDHTIRLRDTETGQEILTLRGRSSQILSVAFSPDSRRLASGGGFGRVNLWNIETGQSPKTLKGFHFRVDSLKFSLDGKTLASNNQNVAFLTLWDVASGQEIKHKRGAPPPWVLGANPFNIVNINGRKIQVLQDEAQIKLSDFETKSESARSLRLTIRNGSFIRPKDASTLPKTRRD
ncbi:MAG: WD40 repeat domain-containing protein [Acidobacteria bacterium]|jgi:WD40 repeat protein|nr:WD40 repeat domain-containing protein [Acidobacteriota bacterium]